MLARQRERRQEQVREHLIARRLLTPVEIVIAPAALGRAQIRRASFRLLPQERAIRSVAHLDQRAARQHLLIAQIDQHLPRPRIQRRRHRIQRGEPAVAAPRHADERRRVQHVGRRRIDLRVQMIAHARAPRLILAARQLRHDVLMEFAVRVVREPRASRLDRPRHADRAASSRARASLSDCRSPARTSPRNSASDRRRCSSRSRSRPPIPCRTPRRSARSSR